MQNIFDQVKIPQAIQTHIPLDIQKQCFNHLISVESLEWIESTYGTLEEKLTLHKTKVKFFLQDFPELNLLNLINKQLKNDWLLVAFLNPELSSEQLLQYAHTLELPINYLLENACLLGRNDFFVFLYSQFFEYFNIAECFRLAAYHGHSDILAFLVSSIPNANQYVVEMLNAASLNSKNIIITEFLESVPLEVKLILINPASTNLLINLIAQHNNELLIKLIQSLPPETMSNLAKANDFQLLKTAYQHNNQTLIEVLSKIADPLNSPEKFKYIVSFMEIACVNNHPNIINDLWQVCSNTQSLILMTYSQHIFLPITCQHGSLDVLKFLLDKHQSYFSQQSTETLLLQLLNHAMKARQLNALKFLHGLIEPSKQNTCLVRLLTSELFTHENLELLIWIFANTYTEDIQDILIKDHCRLALCIWSSQQKEIISLMLTLPKVFAYLDKNILNERVEIETFANGYSDNILFLTTHLPQRADIKLQNPSITKLIFYIILHHIKRNTEGSCTYVKKLLDVPELRAIAHLGEEDNQLLKTAKQELNFAAQRILLAIPNVALTDSLNQSPKPPSP